MTAREPEPQDTSSLKSRSIRGVIWSASGQGTRALIRIIVLTVMARLITPEEFGVMSAALVVMGFTAMFSQLGFGPALVQRPEITKSHISTAFTSSVLLSLAVGGVLVAAAPFAASFFGFDELESVLMVIAIEFPIIGLGVVGQSLIQRELRFRTTAAINVASQGVGYIAIGIPLAVAGFGVWALVLAHITMGLVSTVSYMILERRHLRPGFDRVAFRELLGYGGGFTIAKILNYVARQADNIVTGRWLGAAALGYYSRAYTLLVFPINQLTFVSDQVLFPVMSRLQESTKRMLAAFRRGTTVMAVIFGPVGVFAFVLAPELVLVALGPQWTETIDPFRVLAAGMLFRAGYQVSDTLTQAAGAVYPRAWRQGVYAAAVLIGAWVGQHWGLVGLSAGVLAAVILNYFLMAQLTLKVTSWTWSGFAKAHVSAMSLSAIALAVSWTSAYWLRGGGLSNLVVLIVAGVATAAAIGGVIIWRPRVLGQDQPWMSDLVRQIFRRGPRRDAAARASEDSDPTPGEGEDGGSDGDLPDEGRVDPE